MIREKDLLDWVNARCGVAYQAVEQCQSGYVHAHLLRSYYPAFRFSVHLPKELGSGSLNAAEKSENFDAFVEMCREVDLPVPPSIHDEIPSAILGSSDANAAIIGWLHQYFSSTASAPVNTVSKIALEKLDPLPWTQPLPDVALNGSLPAAVDSAVAVNAYATTLSAVVQDAHAFAELLRADAKDTAALAGALQAKAAKKAAAAAAAPKRTRSKVRRR